VDFTEALARVGRVLREMPFFVPVLPYSDAIFGMAFERECTETFWHWHVRAFASFGGVPRQIAYDNARAAVAQILGGEEPARKFVQGSEPQRKGK